MLTTNKGARRATQKASFDIYTFPLRCQSITSNFNGFIPFFLSIVQSKQIIVCLQDNFTEIQTFKKLLYLRDLFLCISHFKMACLLRSSLQCFNRPEDLAPILASFLSFLRKSISQFQNGVYYFTWNNGIHIAAKMSIAILNSPLNSSRSSDMPSL